MKNMTGFKGFVVGVAFAITLMAIAMPIVQTKAKDVATGQDLIKVEPTIDWRSAQPHLEKSSETLRVAKTNMQSSVEDQNGHRDAAIEDLDHAIEEWNALIDDVRHGRAG